MKLKHRFIMLLAVSGCLFVPYFFTQIHRPISNFSKADSSTILVQATKADVDMEIPKKLYSCLPRKVERLKLLASNTTEQDNYYLVAIYLAPQTRILNEPPPSTYEETLVKLDALGCLVVVPKEKMGSVSLTQYIPESIARSLSLQMYQQAIIKAGGKEKFQQLREEGDVEAGDISYLFPEEAWALRQLGINIHPNTRVVTNLEQL